MKLAHLIPIIALSNTCYAGITAPQTGSNINAAGELVTNGNQSTFTINTIGSSASPSQDENYRFGGSNDASGFLTGIYDINVTGGNAIVRNNPSGSRIKGITVELDSGVTEFDVTLTYNRYIHGLSSSNVGASLPLLLAGRYFAEGTDTAGTSLDYVLKQTYSSIASIAVASAADQSIANGTAIQGLPTTNPTDLTYRKLGKLGATTIEISGSGSTQEYSVTSNQSGLQNWIGTHSILYGNSLPGQASDQGNLADDADLLDGDIQGIQQISAKTVKLTFTAATGSTFRKGATFNLSMDGRQEVALQDKLEAVPEPASITFFAIGGLCLMGRRKRR